MLPCPNHVPCVVDSIMICEHVPNHEFVFVVVYQDTLIENVRIVRIYQNVSFVEFALPVVIIATVATDVPRRHRRTMPRVLCVVGKDIFNAEK